MRRFLQKLRICFRLKRSRSNPADVPGVASGDLMKRLVRDADYRRWMKDYLAGG